MFIIGLSLTCFSVPFAICMFSLLGKINSNPYAFRFTNGFTEDTIAILAFVSIIIAIVGILLIIFGLMSRRNKAALKTIENHSKLICPRCNVNVSNKSGQCPICGEKLNVR